MIGSARTTHEGPSVAAQPRLDVRRASGSNREPAPGWDRIGGTSHRGRHAILSRWRTLPGRHRLGSTIPSRSEFHGHRGFGGGMKATRRLKVDDAFHNPAAPVTTHLGRAGEYFVAAQLLRMGFNTSPLPVDTGVDLLAHWTAKSGDSRAALVQVKSTVLKRTTIRLTKTQVDRITAQGVNLVLVFWGDPQRPFALVIPPALFYMLTSGGFKSPAAPIRIRAHGADIVVRASSQKDVFIRNLRTNLGPMVNRFDRLAATDEDPRAIPDYAEWTSDGDGLLRIIPQSDTQPDKRIQPTPRRARRG